MSITILTPEECSPGDPFFFGANAFELVCKSVREAASREGLYQLAEECELAALTSILSFDSVPDEMRAAFGRLLQNRLDDGSILKEMLSWKISPLRTPRVLAENQTPEVAAYFVVLAETSEMRRMAKYLECAKPVSAQRDFVPSTDIVKPQSRLIERADYVSIKVGSQTTGVAAFTISKRLFDLICAVIGTVAEQNQRTSIQHLCRNAPRTGSLHFDVVDDGNKYLFGTMLRDVINDGTLVREVYSWPVPEQDVSTLVPENRTPDVQAFIYVESQMLPLRRFASYLGRHADPWRNL